MFGQELPDHVAPFWDQIFSLSVAFVGLGAQCCVEGSPLHELDVNKVFFAVV